MSTSVTTGEPSTLDNWNNSGYTYNGGAAPYTNNNYNTPAPPTKKQGAVEKYPTLFKWIIKIGTVVLGLLTILMGILTFVTISFKIRRLFAGIILMYVGFWFKFQSSHQTSLSL
jgi:hypothetical protein